jgi:hypothetical protein
MQIFNLLSPDKPDTLRVLFPSKNLISTTLPFLKFAIYGTDDH